MSDPLLPVLSVWGPTQPPRSIGGMDIDPPSYLMKIMQINTNHSRPAQDLVMHVMRKRGASVALIAEPHNVPSHPCWIGSEDRSSAIIWTLSEDLRFAAGLLSGPDFVAIDCGEMVVFSCYFSPNRPLTTFRSSLDTLSAAVKGVGHRPVIVAGDFNGQILITKSPLWGSALLDTRGEEVEHWASLLGLRVVNSGSESTCSRWQGDSIMDLTWCSASIADHVRNWRVDSHTESLSDHAYISFEFSAQDGIVRVPTGPSCPPSRRWCLKKLVPDLLRASTVVHCWSPHRPPLKDLEAAAEWLREGMHRACEASMPLRDPGRYTGGPPTWPFSELRASVLGGNSREQDGKTIYPKLPHMT